MFRRQALPEDRKYIMIHDQDASYEDKVPHFKEDVNLLYHQTRVVHHAINMENDPKNLVGCITDFVGSGKTFIILAIISINYTPLPPRKLIYDYNGAKIMLNTKKVINTTVCFINRNVFKQWAETLKMNTTIKYYEIINITHITKLKDPEAYDLIFVKNGKTNRTPDKKYKHLIELLRDKFSNICFKRVIFDDLDSKNIPINSFPLLSQFTWLVSADQSISFTGQDDSLNYYHTYFKHFNDNNLKISLRTEKKLLDSSIRAPKIEYIFYKLISEHDKYLEMLNGVDENATAIIEAVNGDAFGAAAEIAGIKSTSVFDIFKKILKNNTDAYHAVVNKIAYVKKIDDHYETLETLEEFEKRTFKGFLTENVKNIGPFAKIKKKLAYQYNAYDDEIGDIKSELKTEKNEIDKPLERLRSNIREGCCPLSGENLADVDEIIILNCCAIVISAETVQWGIKLNDKAQGTCPNCRATVKFSELIFVKGNDIKFEAILKDENVAVAEPEVQQQQLKEPEKELQKKDYIIAIAKNQKNITDKGRVNHNYNISGILTGNFDFGFEDTKRKMLIFANFDESIDKIAAELTANEIKFGIIMGSATQIDNMKKRYWLPYDDPNAVNILIINSLQYAQGMNLQNTTDLVFYHKIVDKRNERQLAGRAMRYGRENNLRIHYILNVNEYKLL